MKFSKNTSKNKQINPTTIESISDSIKILYFKQSCKILKYFSLIQVNCGDFVQNLIFPTI